jgi:hypothetical protein
VELAMATLRASGRVSLVHLNFAIMVAYNCAIFVWFAYSFSKSPAREHAAQLLTPARWDRSLYDAQRPAGGDSLIPMFEGMVERAFSRTQNSEEPQEALVAQVETPVHSTVIRKLASITGLASMLGLSFLSRA